MGNIFAMLYMGSRVYLSERNPALAFLRRIGCVVSVIESDYQIAGLTSLEKKDANINRSIVKKLLSDDSVHSSIEQALHKIVKNVLRD